MSAVRSLVPASRLFSGRRPRKTKRKTCVKTEEVTNKEKAPLRHEEIAQRAKEIWEREGQQPGRDMDYWLQAERELLSARGRAGNKPAKEQTTSPDPERKSPPKFKGPGPSSRIIRI